MARQKEEDANIAEWDDVQAMMDADHELALKNKSFKEVQKAFDKTISWINSFVPMDKEVVKGSGKKAESSGKEAVSKKRARKGLDEKVAMLDDFDKQYVLDLYKLVKERFKTTSLEGYDRLLWGDLMTLFEPRKEYEIWKNHQDYTLISWRLYDSCGIHLLLMDTEMSIQMLVEKQYPLTQEMLSRMLSGRLEVDHECEMAYELIMFIKSQYKK
nr:hypothetical protein [Tanacetum cinerariifolium]